MSSYWVFGKDPKKSHGCYAPTNLKCHFIIYPVPLQPALIKCGPVMGKP